METYNRLADKRYLTTKIATIDDQSVILETSHNRYAKRIETEVYVAQRDGSFVVRNYTVGVPSIGNGIVLAKEPVARWSAKRAWDMHDFALQNLYHLLAAETGDVAADLLALLSESEDAGVLAWHGAWKS